METDNNLFYTYLTCMVKWHIWLHRNSVKYNHDNPKTVAQILNNIFNDLSFHIKFLKKNDNRNSIIKLLDKFLQ